MIRSVELQECSCYAKLRGWNKIVQVETGLVKRHPDSRRERYTHFKRDSDTWGIDTHMSKETQTQKRWASRIRIELGIHDAGWTSGKVRTRATWRGRVRNCTTRRKICRETCICARAHTHIYAPRQAVGTTWHCWNWDRIRSSWSTFHPPCPI